MNFKILWLPLLVTLSQTPEAAAFVHISQLRPRLPVDPERKDIVFNWNGVSPQLEDKGKVLGGIYAAAEDREMMQALLEAAVKVWNDVPTAYVEFVIIEQPVAIVDPDDETFSIVVEEQDSLAVAAAARPSFISQDPYPSELENDPKIIHDCDISVSDSSVEAKSLLTTLIHELGHCLGLGHPHSTYHSIMSYSPLQPLSTLTLDDEAGITFLYPEPGESQDVESLTCGTVGGRGASPWLTAVYLLPLGVIARRRRRRPERT